MTDEANDNQAPIPSEAPAPVPSEAPSAEPTPVPTEAPKQTCLQHLREELADWLHAAERDAHEVIAWFESRI